jgi:hypothetical protein
MHARHDAYGIEPTIVRSFHPPPQAQASYGDGLQIRVPIVAGSRHRAQIRLTQPGYKCLQQLTDRTARLPYRTVVRLVEPLIQSKEPL